MQSLCKVSFFLEKKEGFLDYVIEQGGKNLSGGQKQRLAIARALYTDPDILILDEATSALDLKTEEEFCEVLKSLKGEKTIIAIAHRLSTIRFADKIVFMENGKIPDIAPFEELMNRNRFFKEYINITLDGK